MKKIYYIFLFIALLSSCAMQEKVLYLQDNPIEQHVETVDGGEIRLKPNDMVSIYVSSRNTELASVFNLPRIQQTMGSSSSASASSGQNGVLSYTVNDDGNIDFPILGEILVEGLTRQEIVNDVKNRIVISGMLKDPMVTVDFSNLTFSTLGEVANPGQYSITKNRTTILEALSMSGDLTINGQRDRVFLTRRSEGKLITYQLDLRSKDIYMSPAFFVHQNDIIYVEPNKIKSNQTSVNGNTVRSTSFWMSLASFITTITILIVN